MYRAVQWLEKKEGTSTGENGYDFVFTLGRFGALERRIGIASLHQVSKKRINKTVFIPLGFSSLLTLSRRRAKLCGGELR